MTTTPNQTTQSADSDPTALEAVKAVICDVDATLIDAETAYLKSIPGLDSLWEHSDIYFGEVFCTLVIGHLGPHVCEVGNVSPTWGWPSYTPTEDLKGSWWFIWNQGRPNSRRIEHADMCGKADDGKWCDFMVGHSGPCVRETLLDT